MSEKKTVSASSSTITLIEGSSLPPDSLTVQRKKLLDTLSSRTHALTTSPMMDAFTFSYTEASWRLSEVVSFEDTKAIIINVPRLKTKLKLVEKDFISYTIYGDEKPSKTDSFRPKDLSFYKQIYFHDLNHYRATAFGRLSRIRNTDQWDKLAIVLQRPAYDAHESPCTDMLDTANHFSDVPYAYRGKMTRKKAEYYFFHRYDLSTI